MARDGGRGRGDSRDTDPYAEGSGGDTGPVDIVAVRHDDALIDAIASGQPGRAESTEESQLAAMLADWRSEIVTPPLPDSPDLDTVVAAVNQEIGAREARISAHTGGRLRLLRPIAGTAAAVALVMGGMTAFSYAAEPGDPLWRVKEVVFTEQAQSTVVQRADDNLAAAESMLAEGDLEQASTRMEQVSTNAGQISDPAERDLLLQRWHTVLAELRNVAPGAAEQLERNAPPPPGSSQLPTTPLGSSVPGSSLTSAPGSSSKPVSPTRPSQDDQLPTIMGVEPGGPGSSTPSRPPSSTQTMRPTEPSIEQPTQPSNPGSTSQLPPSSVVPPTILNQPPTTLNEPPTILNEPSTGSPSEPSTGGGSTESSPGSGTTGTS